ncbi:Phosphatidylinositol 4,5-bisphosphate 3-kinase catalytic subunit gamma isoform [Coelomomyces lativittatus]|nr:Phosphatidylinositol 4,5-bisphosphate 3-kinase catalytic subunit gamma isoform [Coelomomyces lativittatus]
MLTLQMFQLMDQIWQRAMGLDLKLSIYQCVCTGKEQGWIQMIPDAETVSSIQLKYGGSTAAFKEEPLAHWIKSHNPMTSHYETAVMNFTLSCAGYCVATYCLGIGDRHNDNIMCTHRGRLFHIDFGHFLGNTKKKFGIKREIAPFVLTPDFIYVITSSQHPENFNFFVSTCVKAFIALRRQSHLILHLFMLMCNSGIPELASYEDIYYLRDSFCLGLSEADAAVEFQNLILLSIRLGWSTQLNWWVHNLVHPK